MDRNALLTASRVVFLEAFRHATNDALMLATAAIFRKANFSCSDSEQRTLFEAHRVLQEKVTELRAQLQCQMLLLLDRSLESAYKTFHPASQSSFTGDTLALVEAMHFEDQLRTDGITARFRNASR